MSEKVYPDDYCRADVAAYGLCQKRAGHGGENHADAHGHRWPQSQPHRSECSCGRCPAKLEVIATAAVKVGDVLLPEEYDEHLGVDGYDATQAVCEVVAIDDSQYRRQDYRDVSVRWPDGVVESIRLHDEVKSLRLVK